jgi:arylsulfatase A-like enzyme
MSPWGHGVLGYAAEAKRWPFEKPRALHDAGYYSVSIGKNHFTPMRNTHGYDRVTLYDGTPESDQIDDYGQWLRKTAPAVDEHSTGLGWNDRAGKPWPHDDALHPTHWTGQQAVDFLNGFRDAKSFYLKVSFHRPHSPFDPPMKWFDYYAKLDLPGANVGSWAEDWFGSFKAPQPPSAPRAALSKEEIRNSRQGYYGSISDVDEQIGRIMDTLKTNAMLENTLIIFISDHGEMVGDQHLWRKSYAYEGSSRIPMIVRWGSQMFDAKRGQVLPQLTELRDVLSTLLDAAGVSVPAHVEGKSLLKLIQGKTEDWRTQLDLEHSMCYFNENQWTALTDGKYKYIYHAFNGKQQLFDLDQDPNELNDLAQEPAHAGLRDRWRSKMVEHLSVRGSRWVLNDDLVLRKKAIPYGGNFPSD